jgi:hypothetical protein
MCLTELDFSKDITRIIQNSGPEDGGTTPGRFPYSYWVKTSVSTPANNPNDLSGQPPPMPPIPCQPVPPADVQAAFNCMETHCDTIANDTGPMGGQGTLPGSTDCLSSNCSGPISTFLFNSQYNACFDCIIDYVASDQQYSTALQQCTTVAETPYGFDGQLPNLILSRYPLLDTDYYVLPSSQYRQGVLFSRVQLEDQQVDFYCGFFTSTLVAQDLPYTGPYGNGGSASTSDEGGAYANEQYLQALNLINWVKQKSGDPSWQPCPATVGGPDGGTQTNCVHPAIIMGDWRASVGVANPGPQDGGLFTSPSSIVPGTVGTLANAAGWTAVAAPGWVPQCMYCPQAENPLNVGETKGYFMTQPFLYAWGANKQSATTAAQVESLLYTQPAVSAGATSGFPAGTMLPLSQYFGVNVQLVRPF